MSSKVKACLRCGCTEDRACTGGCSWVAETLICSACLTELEQQFYDDLIMRIAAGVKNARKQLKLFGQIIVLSPRISEIGPATNPANSGGGGIVNITKNTKTGHHRVHAGNANGAPVCGGGNSARSAQWQQVIIEPDCQRCAQILIRKNQPKEPNVTSHESSATC